MTNINNWYLKYENKPHAPIRLFCFHHSGGGASVYHPWLKLLSPNIEMIAIQLPGRESRFTEPLTNNLNEIVEKLTEHFNFYKGKPYIIFGHSLGGLLAYEFTKSIQRHYSLLPNQLIISATKAPHLPFRMKHLSKLDSKALKEELKVYNGIDEHLLSNDELLELFLPIIKSDFSISETYNYTHSNPLSCDILAISGTEDKTVNENEVQAWSKHTEGKFEHTSIAGGHFFIKEHQKEILELINQNINRYIY